MTKVVVNFVPLKLIVAKYYLCLEFAKSVKKLEKYFMHYKKIMCCIFNNYHVVSDCLLIEKTNEPFVLKAH